MKIKSKSKKNRMTRNKNGISGFGKEEPEILATNLTLEKFSTEDFKNI